MAQPFLSATLVARPRGLNITPTRVCFGRETHSSLQGWGEQAADRRQCLGPVKKRGTKSTVLWGGHSSILPTNI